MKFRRLYPSENEPIPRFSDIDPNRAPFPRSGHRLLALEDKVYVIGGYNPSISGQGHGDDESQDGILREIFCFNVTTSRWEKLKSSKNVFPDEMASHCAESYNNFLLLYGGSGYPFGQRNSNKLFAFNLKTNRFRLLQVENGLRDPNIPEAGYGQATVLDGHNLYVVGGTSGFDFNCDVHKIDLQKSPLTWKRLTSNSTLDLERYRHECVISENRLIIFGGGKPYEARSLDILDCFDLKSSEWTSLKTKADENSGFPGPRRCLGLARHKNRVYICGGTFNDVIYDDVWKFDLETFQWEKMPLRLPRPVYFHGFCISPDGGMYVYGGVAKKSGASDVERTGELYSFRLAPPTLRHLCSEKIFGLWSPKCSENSMLLNDYGQFYEKYHKSFDLDSLD